MMYSARIPESVRTAITQLRTAVELENLSQATRAIVSATIRRQVLPKRNEEHRRARYDAAWIDYSAGVRGLKFFRKHIVGHDRMSHWRRAAKEKQLMNAMHKRASRERARERCLREGRSSEAVPRPQSEGNVFKP
jgi:hypothetical protein